MKIVNYKRGYSNRFECTIHGTIYMAESEYNQAIKYLLRTPLLLGGGTTPYLRDMLKKDIERKINIKGGFIVNIRTTATGLLVGKFQLKNYKLGNYQLSVKCE